MPMKISLALGPRRPLSRETAWGCLTSNLAFPGLGSLVAGRASGYGQVALGVLGLILTMVFGVRFITWYIQHWSTFFGSQSEPLETMPELWRVVRLPLLGIAIFVFGLLWALATGLDIVREAKSNSVPPRLS